MDEGRCAEARARIPRRRPATVYGTATVKERTQASTERLIPSLQRNPRFANRLQPLLAILGQRPLQQPPQIPRRPGRQLADQSGSLLTTASSTSGVVAPANARLPVSISYSTAPKEKISLRRSTGRPTACSGDMYAAVPRITPVRVWPSVSVGELASDDGGGSSSSTLAKPKSSTFTTPSGVILMFAGFRSRWTTPRSCAYSSASMICFEIATRLVERDWSSLDAIRQRRSFDEREDQPARVFGVHDSVNVSDVGMVERSQNLGFALEASHAVGIAQERRGQDFERDVALERRVARAVDLAHAALAEQGEDFVVTELCRLRTAACA